MQRARNSSVLDMKGGVPKLIYTEEGCEYHMVLPFKWTIKFEFTIQMDNQI